MYADKPDRVKGLAYEVTGLTSVKITWEKPNDNNSPITHYIVRCVRKCTIPPVLTDDTFAVIGGLGPNYIYEFTVSAINKIDEGRRSDLIEVQSSNSGMHKNIGLV